jgi:(1->4)-alpha-D-glucan 1-alpha-D-glucosylmutase
VIPGATYRVQLNSGFGFVDAAAIVPYLERLGITHLYCSPYLQAVPGSDHGYDVVDPRQVSSDLGAPAGHRVMVEALGRSGLGHILDIVPNHMATASSNRWWWDVLEKGPGSPWAGHFDIDWTVDEGQARPRVLAPILGDDYRRALENGELTVERLESGFQLVYHEHRLPIALSSLQGVLANAGRATDSPGLIAFAESLGRRGAEPDRETQTLADLLQRESDLDAAVAAELDALNSDLDRLDAVLARQNYRLAYWRLANEEIDYRRFFNIETLVGVRVEDPVVFASTHGLILQLVRDGAVSGLRVDHIDGLREPEAYLSELTRETEGNVYLVVEKILEPGETLPSSWPIHGTTGYDFVDRVNQLFVAGENESEFDEIYVSFTGESAKYPEVVHDAKHEIMSSQLAAEVNRLAELLARITSDDRQEVDYGRDELRQGLTEYIAGYEVYRTYVSPGGVADNADRREVATAVAAATRRHHDPDLIAFLGRLACGDQRDTAVEREFTQRLQQVTAPVMAKGVEDTAFYRFNRLVSLNEVGGNPGDFGRPVERFHRATTAAARHWPHTMLTLTTHDTKRSADVRARINVLSELPGPWRTAIESWADLNAIHRAADGPDSNTEYLLYQTLVGAWPIATHRVVEYLVKATREARVHTSWIEPNSGFEEATTRFARAILEDRSFTDSLRSFLAEHRIVERGRRNSLSQVALAMTVPGVPDVYQGDELWNLRLVDPDNRRPVDFEQRRRAMESLDPSPVLSDDDVGVTKLRVLHSLLHFRKENRDLVESSEFEPVEVDGPSAEDVVAFRRGTLLTIVAVRSDPDLSGTVDLPTGGATDVMTGIQHAGGVRPLGEILAESPFTLLGERGP